MAGERGVGSTNLTRAVISSVRVLHDVNPPHLCPHQRHLTSHPKHPTQGLDIGICIMTVSLLYYLLVHVSWDRARDVAVAKASGCPSPDPAVGPESLGTERSRRSSLLELARGSTRGKGAGYAQIALDDGDEEEGEFTNV